MGAVKKYTEKEKQFIIANNDKSIKWMAEKLGRSEDALYAYRARIKLNKASSNKQFENKNGRLKKIQFKVDNNGCFICTSHKAVRYPMIFKNYEPIPISRHIYEECFGFIPIGMEVCHKCDNVKCINPEHLFLGTHKDNMKDCNNKNRLSFRFGEYHHSTKLTSDNVLKIRKDDRSTSEIAKFYNVSRMCIYQIKNNKTWRWL